MAVKLINVGMFNRSFVMGDGQGIGILVFCMFMGFCMEPGLLTAGILLGTLWVIGQAVTGK